MPSPRGGGRSAGSVLRRRTELLEELLGRPVVREPDHGRSIWLRRLFVGVVHPPSGSLSRCHIRPSRAMKRSAWPRWSDRSKSLQARGWSGSGLHVVTAEPRNVLQRHTFCLVRLPLVENGVGDARQAIVGAGVQAGHKALVLAAARTGRGKAEALVQRRQFLRRTAPVQREEPCTSAPHRRGRCDESAPPRAAPAPPAQPSSPQDFGAGRAGLLSLAIPAGHTTP